MPKPLFLLAIALAGLGVGGGAAFGVRALTAVPAGPQVAAEPDWAFVPTGPVLAPLVFPDGRLAGYVAIETQLQVPADQAEAITARMPLLLHEINLRTFRTPMAAGPDGLLPNLKLYRAIVDQAAPAAFGAGVVKRAAIVQARPA